ncbi:hypothetical protein SHANETTE_151 [Bacillus phage Shanette]|uniref:ATP-binding protein n=1 Tax=Bacillus phage Shanette TaxID=1296656 RepID=S5MMU4_9CAUD|nr:hypothetical protein AVV46_gp146 [Bacillus phage Shanette]AGR47045.1 hypothetical protein SHANETTE_151 [Bacillus phage Shanette]
MNAQPEVNIVNPTTKEKIRLVEKEEIQYVTLEVIPSKMTSNAGVRWLITEFATLFTPLNRRINFAGGRLVYTPEMNIWWEVVIHKGQVKFYLVIPDKDHLKDALTRQIRRCWKRSTVREVKDPLPNLHMDNTSVTKMSLQNHPALSLDVENPKYTPLDSILTTTNYLKDEDYAILQLGMRPLGESWNETMVGISEDIKEKNTIPKKKGTMFTSKNVLVGLANVVGLVLEELMNIVGDFLIPGWEMNSEFRDSLKRKAHEGRSKSSLRKKYSEGFKINFNAIAVSDDEDRRRAITRSLTAGFHPLEGDNKIVTKEVEGRDKVKALKNIRDRKMVVKMNGDELCSLELAKIIQVPDQVLQLEHAGELDTVQHRSLSDIPKEIFEDDGKGIPFATYEDTDGETKTVYFAGDNPNLLCMSRVVIGEPGSGKSTFAASFALDALEKGYGSMVVDAADGKLAQRILNLVPPEKRDKVKIIDFLNSENPVGLGWNEIFRGRNTDVIEDLITEEILSYVELVAGTELSMTSRIWVENAVRAVYTTPDATLQDIENMLSNAEYRARIIPHIDDPELRSDWEYFHEKMSKEDRKAIYEQAFRRLAVVMRKKALKSFILQKPKKDENGEYLVDFRKWMDEGCLVLVKANETLGEENQTALVSFLISKFNLAIISREDIEEEDDRKPCFIVLDEPDHYIKGSERWRSMLTRYRKYRCGLTFMFHGWEQLKKADRELPKMIRKAGPHYVIFQTDRDNLKELESVIQPEFSVDQISKGMPKHHAIVKLKMYNKKGEATPPFMVKAINEPEKRYKKYDNNDLYDINARLMGRPKQEVLNELFRYKNNAEFSVELVEGEDKKGKTPPKNTPIEIDEDERREQHEDELRTLEKDAGALVTKLLEDGDEEGAEEIMELLEEVLSDDGLEEG